MSLSAIFTSRVSIGSVDDIRALTDEAVLELSLKKPSAFGALLDRYQSQFLSRAQNVVGDKDKAEDVVQETFVRIYRFAPRFKGEEGSFRAWSLTILMNVARTHYARGARDRGRTAQLEPEHYESLADTVSPKKEEEAAYAKDIVKKALAFASADVVEIMTLAFIDDLPYADIATRLKLSTPAVKTRVHRAKAVLKKIITTHNLL